MKNKKLITTLIVVLCVSLSGAQVAFAYWMGRLISDKNTITVDTFVSATITETSLGEGSEHNGDTVFEAEFKITKYLNDGKNYNLVLADTEFYQESDNEDWITELGSVWQISFNGTEWNALAGNEVLKTGVANQDVVSVYLRLSESAPTTYALGTLKLTAKIVEEQA